jgi:hypothetical protein
MVRVASFFVLIASFLCAARGATDNEDSAVRKRRQQLVYNVADGGSSSSNAAMNKVRGYSRLSQQHRDLFSGEDEKVFLNRLLFDSQDSVKSAKATPKPTRKLQQWRSIVDVGRRQRRFGLRSICVLAFAAFVVSNRFFADVRLFL